MKTQIVGVCLAILGFLGTILICALPMWKVSAFIQSNIITAQVFWEGLWMNCVFQSTGQSQCKNYDSILALPQELQASRALICVSIAVSVVGVFGNKNQVRHLITVCLTEAKAKTFYSYSYHQYFPSFRPTSFKHEHHGIHSSFNNKTAPVYLLHRAT
uniref:Claudin n=1 Tax=Neolamprologus brichardi TaxID=32507 RepID=A0A3Q4G128_NEOBR